MLCGPAPCPISSVFFTKQSSACYFDFFAIFVSAQGWNYTAAGLAVWAAVASAKALSSFGKGCSTFSPFEDQAL